MAKSPIQVNKTGLPDQLKNGIESLSGYSLDDVKIHYNSEEPICLKTYEYAQGKDTHITEAQKKHLPHESWHIVQQKQGRIKSAKQINTITAVNDDDTLEDAANEMGRKALDNKT